MSTSLQIYQSHLLARPRSSGSAVADEIYDPTSTHWVNDFRPGPKSGGPSVREVLKRPDGRWFRTPSLNRVLAICELSCHGSRPSPAQLPSSRIRLGGGLRDELACVSSACQGRWDSDVVASQVSVGTGCLGSTPQRLRHRPSSQSRRSGATVFHEVEYPKVPPLPTISPFRGQPRVGWSASGVWVTSSVLGRWVGSVRAPDPADPEMDTSRKPASSGKEKTRSSEHPFDPRCTLRGT